MSEQDIEFKGTSFTLSVVHLENNDLVQLHNKLKQKVEQAPQFFNCAPIVIDVSEITEILDFSKLKEVVESHRFVLVGVCGCHSSEQKYAAQNAGLAVVKKGVAQQKTEPKVEPAPVAPPPVETTKIVVQPTKVVHGQIRSGQQIYAKDTDLIVIGSVGNGAEVIADGNIHVYGTIRGRAISGASGRTDTKIFCQNLQAELISIAGVYMLHEQLGEHANVPQRIQIEDQKIVFHNLS
jgi:septum site-determining protein MinC